MLIKSVHAQLDIWLEKSFFDYFPFIVLWPDTFCSLISFVVDEERFKTLEKFFKSFNVDDIHVTWSCTADFSPKGINALPQILIF